MSRSPSVALHCSLSPSFENLQAETHAHRLGIQNEIAQIKTTGKTYARQLKNYEEWFAINRPELSAHPVVATNVALYLKDENVRPKVCYFLVRELVYSDNI